MEKDDEVNPEEKDIRPEDGTDFIQEFIERKKLQNRILQEIIDKLNQAENINNQ